MLRGTLMKVYGFVSCRLLFDVCLALIWSIFSVGSAMSTHVGRSPFIAGPVHVDASISRVGGSCVA